MTTRNTYLTLLRRPGAAHFFLAGLIARYPLAMMTLGIVIMVNDSHGSYGLPGLVASVAIFAEALIAPQLSRAADRLGQTRVALPAACAATAAFVALIAASWLRWPDWTLFVCAAGIGFMPNFGAFSRTRWSALYSGTPLLKSAFAMESLAEEIIWMTGPILAVWCAYHLAPQAAMVVAALIFVAGTLYFCAQTATEPAPHPAHLQRGGAPAICDPAVLLPALILLAFGGFFGVLEIAAAAFAKQLGVPQQTWYPLTAYAVGSIITGSVYGLRHWRAPLPRQLLWMAGAFAATTLPFCFVTGMASLTLIGFIAGTACSPTIIIALGLVENGVAKEKLTEAMTWALVSPPIGMAAGFALAGRLVDEIGAQPTFAATIPFGIAAFAVAGVAALVAGRGGRQGRGS